jgi:hypothetical protein
LGPPSGGLFVVIKLNYDRLAAIVAAPTQGHIMKFEMEFGYFGNNKLVIETHDFDIIEIFQKFVEFQENYGWAVEYAAVDEIEDEFEDGDDTEEELDGAVADAAAEAADNK